MNVDNMKKALFYNKFIALDTESTGFQPNKSFSKLLEIGAVKIENGEIVDRFDELINPGMSIPKKIQELTHITNEDVADKDNYINVISRFYKWCEGDYILIMHNAPHDLKFLNYFGEEAGLMFDQPYIDTQKVAKDILHGAMWERINYHIKENYKLATLAQLYKIPDQSHHRANNDAEVTWLVCKALRQTLTYEYNRTSKNTPVKKINANILHASPWKKSTMQRLYVRLNRKEDNEFADVYYDFSYGCWNIKNSMFPIGSFTEIEEEIKNAYEAKEMEFENFKERKYINKIVNVA